MIRYLALAPMLALAALPSFAGAQAGFQNTVAIDRAVAGFTGHATGEEGGARTEVDTRLRLKACPTLALAWRTAQQDAVVVSCTGPEWRIFVPIRRTVAIAAPAVAQAAQPRAEIVIKRNDPILIEAGGSGFSIQREGLALGDAPAGGRFLARVDGAKAPIQVVAVESGRATLPGWDQ